MSVVPPAVRPLVAVLGQVADLLDNLTDEQYAAKPVGVVPSSVGGHVRHSLDHVEALLAALGDGTLDYDSRRRGTDVERCRRAALEAITRLEEQLLTTSWGSGRRSLRLTALVSPDAAPAESHTTLDRELAFVLSHTVHHNSLIAVMAKLMGAPVPDRFGYAPSTLAHEKARACAR